MLGASSGTRLLNVLDRFTNDVPLNVGKALSFAAQNIAVQTLLVDTKSNNQSRRFFFENLKESLMKLRMLVRILQIQRIPKKGAG